LFFSANCETICQPVGVGKVFPFAGAGFDDTLPFGIFQVFLVQMRFALTNAKGRVFRYNLEKRQWWFLRMVPEQKGYLCLK